LKNQGIRPFLVYIRINTSKSPFYRTFLLAYTLHIYLAQATPKIIRKKDRQSKEPHKDLTVRLVEECYKQGLVVLAAGIFSNVLRFLPPLVITDGQLNEALDILEEAFEASVN